MADYLKRLIRDETLLIQAATSPFMEVDKSKSGSIDEKNLTQVMTVICASLNITKPTPQQIKDLMKKFEKENKGKISFDEYISFLKITIKRHLEKLEGFNEENLRNLQKKDDNNEKMIRKQIFKFEKYLEDSGVALAFEVIYTEILANKIEPDKVFMYTAMRLRQIGREIAHLLPKDLTETSARS